ncbi:MAG TPA: thioredoxin domain-containing protein, partial [Thermodesulfovibrionales bacterium]|nr:thioredoxin domain-containing protein [Thermodesulfovibrionales bacterium]
CHVMAKECFEDEEIIQTLNENFINIKLDRDERPDIDRRYQEVVRAMGAGGGWPLSVFLTPEKKPFFGGTYFPPEDSYGRPGFRKILKAVLEIYRSKRKDITEYSESLLDFIRHQTTVSGEIRESMVGEAEKTILSYFDPQNGGFGSAPKFPMPGALSFLINRTFFRPDEQVMFAIRRTLEAMAKGGFHDQIGGGFHRYSTDEAWVIPHFEKMADDNAWLLRNYIDAYALFGDEHLRRVAEGIVGFIGDVLSDPAGGFYASQDADVTPDDEGGYFTWTDEDFRQVLDDEEYRILSLHFFDEKGAMHHDPSKKVLFVAKEPAQIARETGMEVSAVLDVLGRGREKLRQARARRQTPFIDRTIYTSLNGLLITSYLRAFSILGEESLRDFALKSLGKVVESRFSGGELFHSEGVKAVLDDYVCLIEATVSAYEVTGDASWLSLSDRLMETCTARFWDEHGGGFFDTDEAVVGMRLKGIDDVPHPSPNAAAILLLDRLSVLAEKEKYRQYALRALRTFSLKAGEIGLHAGHYFCGLDAWFHSLSLSVGASPDSGLARAARSVFRPYVSIQYGGEKGRVVPCRKGRCYDPIEDPQELRKFLKAAGAE